MPRPTVSPSPLPLFICKKALTIGDVARDTTKLLVLDNFFSRGMRVSGSVNKSQAKDEQLNGV